MRLERGTMRVRYEKLFMAVLCVVYPMRLSIQCGLETQSIVKS